MNKKRINRIKYCIGKLIAIAENTECKDLHHKKAHLHGTLEDCLAKQELNEIINDLEMFMDCEIN